MKDAIIELNYKEMCASQIVGIILGLFAILLLVLAIYWMLVAKPNFSPKWSGDKKTDGYTVM